MRNSVEGGEQGEFGLQRGVFSVISVLRRSSLMLLLLSSLACAPVKGRGEIVIEEIRSSVFAVENSSETPENLQRRFNLMMQIIDSLSLRLTELNLKRIDGEEFEEDVMEALWEEILELNEQAGKIEYELGLVCDLSDKDDKNQ